MRDDSTDFTSILCALMVRARRTPTDLAQLTDLSVNTLRNWIDGRVRRPRIAMDILKIAQALGLDASDTTALLIAAGHPALGALQIQAHQTNNEKLMALLACWDRASVLPITVAPLPMSSARHQLRAPVGDFRGRAIEIAQLTAALCRAAETGRAAAISGVQGMGGIGKTELAYAVAHEVRHAFPDAQIVLDLHGSHAAPLVPEQALQTVLRVFLPDSQIPANLRALEMLYRSQLDGKRVLVLADDAANASQVEPLLPPVGCALLVTSRARFTLPAMTTIDLEYLPAEEAHTLLHTIYTRLTGDEAATLARACGYLPLALRISASFLRTTPALAVSTYLAQLADERQRLALLRDPDHPQRDVAAALTLSYVQLDWAAQAVFRQLGVFIADFAADLAQAVVRVPEVGDITAILHHLLRRNLVMYDVQRGRWRLHDLLRDLARNYLDAAGETEATMWRYTQAAAKIAQAVHDEYVTGNVVVALSHFDIERPHIDTGQRWAAAHSGTLQGDTLLLAYALATTYTGSIRYDLQHERILQLELALTAAQNLGNSRGVIRVCIGLGSAYTTTGEIWQAIRCYEQALTLARALADQYLESMTLNNLGTSYWKLGLSQQAIVYLEQMLTIAQQLADRRLEGMALNNLGLATGALGFASQALTYHEQALNIARAMGERHGEGIVLSELGQTHLALGNPWYTIETCRQALEIIHEVGDRREEGHILTSLGIAYAMLGKTKDALNLFDQAHTIFRLLGHREGEARCSWHYGLALVSRGEDKRALPLLRVTVAYEQKIGHAKAAEHATFVAQLEAREELPPEPQHPSAQRAIGDNLDEPTD